MRIKNREKNISYRLPLLLLAALFLVSVPIGTKASAMPDSGTLTIHKYSLNNMDDAGIPNNGNEASVPSGAVPLAGVGFTVWQVDPSVESAVTSVADAQQYILEDTKQSGGTDANGKVVFTLERGLYYVLETGNGGNQEVVLSEPFLVSVPMVNPEGNGWITNVHAYPKNQVLAIDKFVGDSGDADYDFTDYNASKYKSVAMYEAFGWSILSSIPANLGTTDSETYTVTDKLESCFDYVQGSLKAYAVPAMNTPVRSAYRLSEGSDYTIVFNSAANTLSLKLTASGNAFLGNRYRSSQDRFLLIKYDCELNSTASHGVGIHNEAGVEYTRSAGSMSAYNESSTGVRAVNLSTGGDTVGTMNLSAGISSNTASSKVTVEPAVHTGKIGITKLEKGTDKALAGAKFGLAVNESDAKLGNYIATGTTDKNGTLTFIGLSYGTPGDSPSENTGDTTYWIVETEAPDGYKLVDDPVEVTFHYQKSTDTGEYYFSRLVVYNVSDTDTKPSESTTSTTTSTTAPTSNTTSSSPKTGDSNTLYLYAILMLLSLAVLTWFLYRFRVKLANGSSRIR